MGLSYLIIIAIVMIPLLAEWTLDPTATSFPLKTGGACLLNMVLVEEVEMATGIHVVCSPFEPVREEWRCTWSRHRKEL